MQDIIYHDGVIVTANNLNLEGKYSCSLKPTRKAVMSWVLQGQFLMSKSAITP